MSKKLIALFSALLLIISGGCAKNNPKTPSDADQTVAQEPLVIYELNPRLYSKGLAFQQIQSRLDEIAKLGVDVIWLMPSCEQGQLKSINSPYCIKDYKKVNPDYGSLSDLKSLVNSAHSKGMKVILDWVANHSAWDNAWIENKSWYTLDAGGNITYPPGTNWTDVADLNYYNNDMRSAMKEAMLYWITECNIDGYRCDHTDGVPVDFWQDVNSEILKIRPDAILLAESDNAALTKAGFNIVYAWNFGSVVKNVFNGKAKPSDLLKQYKLENESLSEGTRRMRYITNHDEASGASVIGQFKGKEAALAGFVVTSLLSDTPLIYSSQEIGYASALSFFDYVAINWDSDPSYTQAYKDYMKAYKGSAALRCGNPVIYNTTDCISIYYSAPKGKGFFAMINPNSTTLSVKTPMERIGNKVKNLLSGAESSLGTMTELKPYEYLLFEIL